MTSDTIVAPATASGEAALAIVRVSGPLVPQLIKDIFGRLAPPRQATLGSYSSVDGEILDSPVFVAYVDGKSYTGEPLLEISPHGNPWLVRKILYDMIGRGCRLAPLGERGHARCRVTLHRASSGTHGTCHRCAVLAQGSQGR